MRPRPMRSRLCQRSRNAGTHQGVAAAAICTGASRTARLTGKEPAFTEEDVRARYAVDAAERRVANALAPPMGQMANREGGLSAEKRVSAITTRLARRNRERLPRSGEKLRPSVRSRSRVTGPNKSLCGSRHPRSGHALGHGRSFGPSTINLARRARWWAYRGFVEGSSYLR
jgi:hypothetical protein